MTVHRFILTAVLVAAAFTVSFPRLVAATPAVQDPARASQAAQTPAAQEPAGDEPHVSGWGATVAKAVNFAILVAVLVYFLGGPLTAYLNGRIGKVREDLVTAAHTRETASRQLADIEARLRALPTEIDALKTRGAEDIVAERQRIEQAAQAERQRLLEHTRREIDMRLRVARRELLELTADLAVRVASERIQRSITAEDQLRLLDRYAAQLQGTQP
jgi:F-type H+-transporting ATPase subunit b